MRIPGSLRSKCSAASGCTACAMWHASARRWLTPETLLNLPLRIHSPRDPARHAVSWLSAIRVPLNAHSVLGKSISALQEDSALATYTVRVQVLDSYDYVSLFSSLCLAWNMCSVEPHIQETLKKATWRCGGSTKGALAYRCVTDASMKRVKAA